MVTNTFNARRPILKRPKVCAKPPPVPAPVPAPFVGCEFEPLTVILPMMGPTPVRFRVRFPLVLPNNDVTLTVPTETRIIITPKAKNDGEWVDGSASAALLIIDADHDVMFKADGSGEECFVTVRWKSGP